MAFAELSRVGPYWRERQLYPSSPDFVPGGAGFDDANITHRNGTLVGNLGSYERAIVDPRGLVTPLLAGWSVDWWVGAEDKWHLPGRAPVVRQRLVDGAPVIETAMRVPGGDSIARVYGMHSTVSGACVVLEIENRSAVPFAVAVAVRPDNILGRAPIHSIQLAGTMVIVNDLPGMLFPREPARFSLANAAGGDAADALFSGAADVVSPDADLSVRCAAGAATAAFVFPLAHTALLRVVLPLAPPVTGRRGRSKSPLSVAYPDALPSAAQVASGWQVQSRRGLQLSLPDQRLSDAVDAARRHLLLAHGGEDLVTWPDPDQDFDDADAVLAALDLHGFHDEAGEVIGSWSDRQTMEGAFAGTPDRLDANAAALAAVARHWRLTGETDLVERLVGPIAKGAHWIEKKRTSRRAPRDAAAPGLLPVGAAPAHAGGPGSYFRDAARSVRALAEVADALVAADQPEVAADARRFAAALHAELDAAVHAAAARGGDDDGLGPIPATPSRPLDGGVVANLELAAPFGPYGPAEPAVAATLDLVREQLLVGDAVFQAIDHAGLSPALTMALATVELETGDRRALRRLAWMLDAGGPTVSWPTTIHPHTGGGSAGRPHDPVATARFLVFVRRLVLREVVTDTDATTAAGLAFCTLVPSAWLGQPIDVRDAPTDFGRCSFSVRWHGDRPALLWEVEPHDGLTAIRLTAPGLDPSWSSTEWKGEALLQPVAPPEPEPAPEPPADDRSPAPDAAPAPVTPPPLFGVPDAVTESPIDLRRPIRPAVAPPDPPPDDPSGGPSDVGGSFT